MDAEVLLIDVNVLVYAFRRDAPDHARYAAWLQSLIDSGTSFAVADLGWSGFLRIVTHPAIFRAPSSIEKAMAFVDEVRGLPQCLPAAAGGRHWDIFTSLCRRTRATGNSIPDAYLAALAIELGAEWITVDRGFAKFPSLRWRHPLA